MKWKKGKKEIKISVSFSSMTGMSMKMIWWICKKKNRIWNDKGWRPTPTVEYNRWYCGLRMKLHFLRFHYTVKNKRNEMDVRFYSCIIFSDFWPNSEQCNKQSQMEMQQWIRHMHTRAIPWNVWYICFSKFRDLSGQLWVTLFHMDGVRTELTPLFGQ